MAAHAGAVFDAAHETTGCPSKAANGRPQADMQAPQEAQQILLIRTLMHVVEKSSAGECPFCRGPHDGTKSSSLVNNDILSASSYSAVFVSVAFFNCLFVSSRYVQLSVRQAAGDWACRWMLADSRPV